MKAYGNLWLISVMLSSSLALAEPKELRPHIIFVVLDDLDFTASAPYLEQVMPFISQQTQKNGVKFTNAHSAAICCEARAALLTGLYAHNNGVFTNGGPWGGYTAFRNPLDSQGKRLRNPNGGAVDNEERTIARFLADGGYRTGFFGKYLNGYETQDDKVPPIPLHWTDGSIFVDPFLSSYLGYNYQLQNWHQGSASLESFGLKPQDYSTDVLTEKALNFLRSGKRDAPEQPQFVYLGYTAPHFPIPPAPRHMSQAARYRGQFPTTSPNYFQDGEDGFTDKAAWLQDSLDIRINKGLKSWVHAEWPKRLGSLLAADEGVQRIWQELEKMGEADQSIVFVTSDNGYNNGSHGLIHKMAPYEESIRVPLYVFAGRDITIDRGTINDAWLAHVDYLPSFLDLARLPKPNDLDGKSFMGQLSHASTEHRSELLFSYQGGYAANGKQLPQWNTDIFGTSMFPALEGFTADIPTHLVIKKRFETPNGLRSYKWIVWPSSDQGLFSSTSWDDAAEELYDLDQDPFELHNLLSNSSAACQPLRSKMYEALLRKFNCHGSSCRDDEISKLKADDPLLRDCR